MYLQQDLAGHVRLRTIAIVMCDLHGGGLATALRIAAGVGRSLRNKRLRTRREASAKYKREQHHGCNRAGKRPVLKKAHRSCLFQRSTQ